MGDAGSDGGKGGGGGGMQRELVQGKKEEKARVQGIGETWRGGTEVVSSSEHKKGRDRRKREQECRGCERREGYEGLYQPGGTA